MRLSKIQGLSSPLHGHCLLENVSSSSLLRRVGGEAVEWDENFHSVITCIKLIEKVDFFAPSCCALQFFLLKLTTVVADEV